MLRSVKKSSHSLATASATGSGDGFQALRNVKIAELRNRCPGLRERIAGSEFGLAFTSGGVSYELVIHLPESFPYGGPILAVEPKAVHPILDELSTVMGGIPELTAYSIHTSLPDVVHRVLSQFVNVPLRRAAASQLASKGYMNGATSSPKKLSIFKEINSMSSDDLREWMTNDLKVQEYVEQMPHVVARKQTLDRIAETNEAIAKASLDQKETLERLRAHLLSICEATAEAHLELTVKQETYDLLVKTFEPEMIRERLKRRAHEADERSEEVAEQFLNGDMSVSTFLKAFAASRASSHERSAKAELLARQLELRNFR